MAPPRVAYGSRRLLAGRPSGAVLWLMVAAAAVFVAYALADGPLWVRDHLALSPRRALRGLELWQLITAPLVHTDVRPLFGNLVSLWVFGGTTQERLGRRGFLAFFAAASLAGVMAACLVGLAIEASPTLAARVPPPQSGCGPAALALTYAFGHFFGDTRLYFFGVTQVRARVLSWILVGIVGLWALSSLALVDACALASGLLVAWLWLSSGRGSGELWQRLRRFGRRGPRLRVLSGGKRQRWIN